jgi:hypothetical protein
LVNLKIRQEKEKANKEYIPDWPPPSIANAITALFHEFVLYGQFIGVAVLYKQMPFAGIIDIISPRQVVRNI